MELELEEVVVVVETFWETGRGSGTLVEVVVDLCSLGEGSAELVACFKPFDA